MPQIVDQVVYANHRKSRVSLVVMPSICGNRFVHLSVAGDDSWCIRDYAKHLKLRSGDSTKTASDIESQVSQSEMPPTRAVGRAVQWKAELEAKSKETFRRKAELDSEPNTDYGKWRPL